MKDKRNQNQAILGIITLKSFPKKEPRFKCPRCGDETLCYQHLITRKVPLAFENGVFEGAGKVVEAEDDGDSMPEIRCGNGHTLILLDGNAVYDKDDMAVWLAEREQINENA